MTMTASHAISPPRSSVDDLLQTAERLFARDGVENVALTQVVAEAGQRNRSALHYHFGSRSGVLTAVLNRRLAPINARREALLDALPTRLALVDIVRADIAPLGEVIVEEAWGADYLSILAQVRFHPQLLGAHGVEDEHLSGLRRSRRLFAEAAPHLADAVRAQRLSWLIDSVVFALARWARDTSAGRRSHSALNDLLDHLSVYGAAGLDAPSPSPKEPQP